MAATPRLHLFHGPDTFSAREALRALREELQVADSNVVRLAGDATVAEIGSAAHTATFFAEPRLVIIDGLGGRSGGRRRTSGRRRQSGAAAAASEMDQIIEVLSILPETTTVVLLEPEATPAFVETFKGLGKATVFPIKRADEMRRWAQERVTKQGATISGPALERLCEMIDGSHAGELAQEIDKLMTYTGGRRIEEADVEELASAAVSHQIWDLTDAVVAGRAERALRVLQRMGERQNPPQVALSMIVRQYRHVLLAQAMLREGYAASKIGERLGIVHPFPLGKVIDQASRFPAEGLERAYRRLLETDAAVKTGVMDIDTALDALIVDLAEIINAGRRRPAEASAGGRRR